jgi:hypothetical protein
MWERGKGGGWCGKLAVSGGGAGGAVGGAAPFGRRRNDLWLGDDWNYPTQALLGGHAGGCSIVQHAGKAPSGTNRGCLETGMCLGSSGFVLLASCVASVQET